MFGSRKTYARFTLLSWLMVAMPLCVTPAQDDLSSNQGVSKPSIVSSEDAWEMLPVELAQGDRELPIWARALVTDLPETTATMLQLDYLHRVESSLDQTTRSKLRWIAAKANRCPTSMRVALADMRRSGMSETEIDLLVEKQQTEFPAEQLAIKFAIQLTLDGSSVTDETVETLIDDYGDEQVVAMVLMLAEANFKDRLLHTLVLADIDDPVLEPIALKQKTDADGADRYSAPERETIAQESARNASDVLVADVSDDWKELDFDALQRQLESQRQRESRIRVPTYEQVAKKLGIDPDSRPPTRVRWSLVCMGYQPELASAWFQCLGTFQRESKQDRVFEESVFWVVTRSIDCFY